jgi:hypothetical protein
MSGEIRAKPVDVKPKPRALLEGLDGVIREQVQGIFPFWTDVAPSDGVHDDDWDVLVTSTEYAVGRSAGLFVVAFGATSVDSVYPLSADAVPEGGSASRRVNAVGQTNARDLYIPAGLPDAIERLVRSDLLAGFNTGMPRTSLEVQKRSPDYGFIPDPEGRLFLDPFLYASDGSVLAGRVRRISREQGKEDREGECWLLPSWVSLAGDWVKAAWRLWHEAVPWRLPAPPDWSDSEIWHTPEEAKIAADAKAVLDEKRRVLADLAEQANALGQEFAKAREAAEAGPRRVLSAQSDDLVAAVQQVLQDLGFEVQNMDLIRKEGDRREDLRIRDANDYEAIAEVRGYKGGAQSNDLLRISRFTNLYVQETGHLPSAQWYIANELLNQDPGTRPTLLLESKPDDVREFGENPGAVISSVALYRLWQRTMSGEINEDEARRMLRDCRGQFTL